MPINDHDTHLSKAPHTPKYINPYSDFGFKKLFGEEANQDLIIDFLNQLLPPKHQITELSFQNPEQLPNLPKGRKAVFDIYCKAKSGEHFIVEMQKAKFDYFKDRSLFYSTFPIRSQSERGKWNFELPTVYFIAILDFEYDVAEERRKFLRHVALKDQDGDLFYDKLHFKFIQMPLFVKGVDELESRFDKWCYFLKYLQDFETIPAILDEPIFQRAFQVTAVAGLTHAEHEAYVKNMVDNAVFQGVVETAVREAVDKERKRSELAKQKALEQAEQERNFKLIKNMIAQGLDDQTIAALTNLDLATIQKIKTDLNGRWGDMKPT